MTADEFLAEFAAILEVPTDKVTMSTPLDHLEGWDSVNVLSYMALVDEKFGREVNPNDIANAQTVSDLFRLASAS